MKTNPAHLLTEMVLHPSTSLSQQEADQFLGSHRSFFQDTSMIVDAPSRKWANCLSCGKTHEVTPLNGLLILSCSEQGVEDVIITADELKSVRFNLSGFHSWLQSLFSLQGNIEASEDKVLLGQGTVNGKQRLFIFSQDNSPQARVKLCQDHRANQPVILYLSTTLNNHNQGYDINLTEYLVVQENNLSIDVSSALGVIEDTVLPLENDTQLTSSNFAIELKLTDDKIVLTGTALGSSYPAFKAKKKRSTAISRLLRTLLKLHESDKETTPKTYKQSVLEANYIDPRKNKQNDLAQMDLSQDKRPLSNLCSSLLPYFFTHRYDKDDGLVIEFKSAISQEDWNGLSDSEKQKILASKAE
ncbi:MAG: hypothetical protein GW946_01570 [Candidatus Pacebacteria bacterium]|nr:hypothetical protein [Candidatus Paceibacterota bacterium]